MNLKLSQEFPVLALKDYGKFGVKLNGASQFSLLKIWKISLEWARKAKFLTLLVIFFWKVNGLSLKLLQEFPVLIMKGYGKSGAKLNRAFQLSLLKIWKISLEWLRRAKFLTLLVIFFWKLNGLSRKLSQEFSVLTMKGYGKFGAKLNGGFQFSLLKAWEFSFEQAKRSKFRTLLLIFFWKLNGLSRKLSQEFSVLTMKGYGKFGAKLNGGFQFSYLKIWKFSFERARRSKFRNLLVPFL